MLKQLVKLKNDFFSDDAFELVQDLIEICWCKSQIALNADISRLKKDCGIYILDEVNRFSSPDPFILLNPSKHLSFYQLSNKVRDISILTHYKKQDELILKSKSCLIPNVEVKLRKITSSNNREVTADGLFEGRKP
jgi:hypothetical protein